MISMLPSVYCRYLVIGRSDGSAFAPFRVRDLFRL